MLAVYSLLDQNHYLWSGCWCDHVFNWISSISRKRDTLVKRFDRLFCDSRMLKKTYASIWNTLLIDDEPYGNVLKNPLNVVHLLIYGWNSKKPALSTPLYVPYQTSVLIAFLVGLKQSQVNVQEYCRQNSWVGKVTYLRRFLSIPKVQRCCSSGQQVWYIGGSPIVACEFALCYCIMSLSHRQRFGNCLMSLLLGLNDMYCLTHTHSSYYM